MQMRKLIVGFACAVILLLAQVALAQQGLTKIADNVYSYVDVKKASPQNSFAANAGIVVGRDGVLVIDTLISAKEADRFIGDIRKVTDKPVRYVVNTHYHLDHSFGNSEFARLGATVISHADDRKSLMETGKTDLGNANAYGLTDEDMRGTTISVPTVAFTGRMVIDLGGETVELIHISPSHTSGSIVVLLPEKKVLFAGDILFTDFHPYLGEGDLAGWIKFLDYIQSLDVTAIVPGHGPLSGKKDVADMNAYLLAFDEKAKALAATSRDADIIASELKKALPARSQGEWLIPSNVREKYLQTKD
jgi:glyoxylase-like metal-dependent hydrolase (beta-lactamase superfamily II)